MPSLYTITEGIKSIVEAEDGELSPDAAAKMDSLSLSLEEKVDALCRYVRHLECDGEAVKLEIDRLARLRTTSDNRVQWLKHYLLESLQKVGVSRMDLPLFKVSICKNSRPTITLQEGAAIPNDFKRVREEFDSGKAYDLWKSGAELPFSVIVRQGHHLRVR